MCGQILKWQAARLNMRGGRKEEPTALRVSPSRRTSSPARQLPEEHQPLQSSPKCGVHRQQLAPSRELASLDLAVFSMGIQVSPVQWIPVIRTLGGSFRRG